MLVYRITLEKHAQALVASGIAARWNSKDVHVIYTSSSRALACLENIVHRNALGLNSLFRTMVIEIPDHVHIIDVAPDQLTDNWQDFSNFTITQRLGDKWAFERRSAVLRVPSVIIPEECNYILNRAHSDFSAIRQLRSEPFDFDTRLKNKGGTK